MANSKGIGIKRKVFLGCIVLGMILFFSSLIAVYEFSKMNNYVSDVIAENIQSINSARKLLDVAESHNRTLMGNIEKDLVDIDNITDNSFADSFSEIRSDFVTPQEQAAADSVMYAYAAYMQVVGEAEEVWMFDQVYRRDWFYTRLQPVYMKFRDYILRLTVVSEDSLISNSQNVQDAFHRSIMPAMISLIFGLVLVLLFNYYLNYYLINPVLRITKGIEGYRLFGKRYDVKVDSTDEIAELNGTVKDIIDLNDSYKNHLDSQNK